MSVPTIPVSEASHRILKEIADRSGQSLTDVLEAAIDNYRRRIFLESVNAGYAALQSDRDEWAEHISERNSWDATLADGLDSVERWTEDGRCLSPEHELPES